MGKRERQDEIVTVKIEDNPQLFMTGVSVMGTREYQQDTYFMMSTSNGNLAVICDGMGGMEHGEIASRKAVEKLAGDFEAWAGVEEPSLFLQQEAYALDRLVAGLTDENGKSIEAGTTIACVIARGNRLYWMSVGDSRIYIARNDEMLCVTRDHNYGYRLEKKLEQGTISQEEYEKQKGQGEALISYLGMNGLEMLDLSRIPFELARDDRVLLCSDGLYKCLSEEVIGSLLLDKKTDMKTVTENLIQTVLQVPKKKKDNTTAVLLEYK